MSTNIDNQPFSPPPDVPHVKVTRSASVESSFSGPVLTDEYNPFDIPTSADLSEALTWNEICNDDPWTLASKFRRSEHMSKMLEAVERARSAAYISFAAKVCAEFLGAPAFITLTGQKDVDIAGRRDLTIVPNRFPYLTEDEISHYLIFSTFPMEEEELDALCDRACGLELDYKRFSHQINQRAVGGGFLYTVHLFVRHKDFRKHPQLPNLASGLLSPKQETMFATDSETSLSGDESFDVPFERPGMEIISWDELGRAPLSPRGTLNLSKRLSRRTSVQKKMKAFQQELGDHFVDQESKILAVDLSLNGWITEDGKVQCNVPIGMKAHKLVKHEFPFEFENGIEHYVLYATYKMDKERATWIVQKELYGYEFHFQRAHGSSTNKNVWEMNVFAKKKPRGYHEVEVTKSSSHCSEQGCTMMDCCVL